MKDPMRGRLGLILPMDNAVIEPEFCELGVSRVSAHALRLDTHERSHMPAEGIRLSTAFNELGVDAIGYACAETSFLGGVDANRHISEQIQHRTATPAVTAIAAMVEALKTLGRDRIAVTAPYRQSSAEALGEYLESSGLNVRRLEHRDFSEESDDPREWYATNRQPPEVARDMARQVNTPDAEVVIIAATNLRSLSVLRSLEEELQKPVVSTNSCLFWALLARADLDAPRLRGGRLIADQDPTMEAGT